MSLLMPLLMTIVMIFEANCASVNEGRVGICDENGGVKSDITTKYGRDVFCNDGRWISMPYGYSK